MIELGQAFPNFSLPNQDGKTVTLDDFKGKWLVVYVYPKDDTPGCTIQGKWFWCRQPKGIGDNGIWRIAKRNGILYLPDVGSKTTSFSSAFAGIFASNSATGIWS